MQPLHVYVCVQARIFDASQGIGHLDIYDSSSAIMTNDTTLPHGFEMELKFGIRNWNIR